MFLCKEDLQKRVKRFTLCVAKSAKCKTANCKQCTDFFRTFRWPFYSERVNQLEYLNRRLSYNVPHSTNISGTWVEITGQVDAHIHKRLSALWAHINTYRNDLFIYGVYPSYFVTFRIYCVSSFRMQRIELTIDVLIAVTKFRNMQIPNIPTRLHITSLISAQFPQLYPSKVLLQFFRWISHKFNFNVNFRLIKKTKQQREQTCKSAWQLKNSCCPVHCAQPN